MPDKLNRTVAIKALHDICSESENLVNSGDVRLAGSARRDYLLSSVVLMLLSGVDDNEFNNTELAKLPTPDELRASADGTTAANIVVGTPSENASAPATPQPQNATDLAAQEGGNPPVSTTADTAASANQANNNTSEQTTANVDANAEAAKADVSSALSTDGSDNANSGNA